MKVVKTAFILYRNQLLYKNILPLYSQRGWLQLIAKSASSWNWTWDRRQCVRQV